MARKVKSAKVIDFDKYINERRQSRPNIEFRVFGQTFSLPPTMPFDVVISLRHLALRSQDDEVSADEVFNMIESVIGAENLAKLRKNPEFDFDLAVVMLNRLISEYTITNDHEADETPGTVGKLKEEKTE